LFNDIKTLCGDIKITAAVYKIITVLEDTNTTCCI